MIDLKQMRREAEGQALEARALIDAIIPLMAGKDDPGVQGAALADLLAMWLAGHVYPGDEALTKLAREGMLELHLKTVWKLVDIADLLEQATRK
jgi:hypothetical protein